MILDSFLYHCILQHTLNTYLPTTKMLVICQVAHRRWNMIHFGWQLDITIRTRKHDCLFNFLKNEVTYLSDLCHVGVKNVLWHQHKMTYVQLMRLSFVCFFFSVKLQHVIGVFVPDRTLNLFLTCLQKWVRRTTTVPKSSDNEVRRPSPPLGCCRHQCLHHSFGVVFRGEACYNFGNVSHWSCCLPTRPQDCSRRTSHRFRLWSLPLLCEGQVGARNQERQAPCTIFGERWYSHPHQTSWKENRSHFCKYFLKLVWVLN